MNLVITGALGHIGSRLIERIPEGKFETVYLVDNLATQRYSSLFRLPSEKNFHFLEEDVLKSEFERFLKEGDVVIHLAAITNAESSMDRKDEVELINFRGTEKMAQVCCEHKCRLLFLSTTSVYGVQDSEVDEDCSEAQLKPQSPYAESKLKAEKMLMEMGSHASLPFVIFRFGTIFGVSRGMRFHTAVNKFIWQASLGKEVTVWSTAAEQKRPYLDLEDAVSALLFAIEEDLFDRSLYNVVTLNASVRMIVDQIQKEIPDLKIKYVDSRIMNQLSYTVSSERIRKRGFIFRGDLTRGIRDTVHLLRGLR